jgi:hypothetical protein
MPLFFVVFYFFDNLFLYILLLVILLFLTYIFLRDHIFLENILYIFYLIFFIIATVYLSIDIFSNPKFFLIGFFDNIFGIFILGLIIGNIYFMSLLYHLFIFTYLPTSLNEKGYFKRIKKRSLFISKLFHNNHNIYYSNICLFLVFILFIINHYFSFLDYGHFLFLFIISNYFFSKMNKLNENNKI